MAASRIFTKGFTLIELLIVVAIIGILAAIAVPNFLNAQLRAKIARVKGDFRSIGTAMESYHIDNNRYPTDVAGYFDEDRSFRCLTTPIAYIAGTDICRDFFTEKSGAAGTGGFQRNFYGYGYEQYTIQAGIQYVVNSFGPDRDGDMPWQSVPLYRALLERRGKDLYFVYEPSNGLNSSGDIILTGAGIANS